jgi:DNA-binding CsgD family transcriptional regulator
VNEAEREADKQERLVTLLSRSPTRQQLVRLLLEGKSRKAIAAAMKRSQHTIDAHLKVIYRTVGVGDRAQLMLLARDLVRKAVPPPPELGSRRIRDVVLPVDLAGSSSLSSKPRRPPRPRRIPAGTVRVRVQHRGHNGQDSRPDAQCGAGGVRYQPYVGRRARD